MPGKRQFSRPAAPLSTVAAIRLLRDPHRVRKLRQLEILIATALPDFSADRFIFPPRPGGTWCPPYLCRPPSGFTRKNPAGPLATAKLS
ncbi:hypothetical protein GMSM_29410 [Geomonas sp. Red276]